MLEKVKTIAVFSLAKVKDVYDNTDKGVFAGVAGVVGLVAVSLIVGKIFSKNDNSKISFLEGKVETYKELWKKVETMNTTKSEV